MKTLAKWLLKLWNHPCLFHISTSRLVEIPICCSSQGGHYGLWLRVYGGSTELANGSQSSTNGNGNQHCKLTGSWTVTMRLVTSAANGHRNV